MEAEIIMLGTGSAFPSKSYNSCFAIRTQSYVWLTDGGGGNGIFPALAEAGLTMDDIRHIFVSHSHTDHILGVVWLLRRAVNLSVEGKYSGNIYVYANSETAGALVAICKMTFLPAYFEELMKVMRLHVVGAGDKLCVDGSEFTFFDTVSENVCQSGFRLRLPSGKVIAAMGDEALTEKNCKEAAGADYLICGAFCRYADREVFRPYEKHHYTVKDVAETADRIGVRHLILVHSEDRTPNKKEAYIKEAGEYFSGSVIVPSDQDRIEV